MSAELVVRTVAALDEVDAAAWDRLAGDDNPFVEHAFLATLEEAGCVGEGTGWSPVHLLVHAGDGGPLVAAAPLYLKTDSYGEFIFDWGWAGAAQRAGLPYYPKLVSAVPFTPATGPRLLVDPSRDPAPLRAALVQGARAVADATGAHSVHWLFVPDEEQQALARHAQRPRLSHQYHWTDHGFGDFEGFLAALTSKRRKEIRRERRQAAESGLALDLVPVTALSTRDLGDLYRCYRATVDAHGAVPYMSRTWFELLPRRLGERALVSTARDDGRLVAASLAFRKGTRLFGRYWGSLVEVPAVHFELSYYRFLEHALATGVTRFEAGAQGVQKIHRGFLPVATRSAHWIRHPGLAEAVYDFLPREAAQVERELAALARHSPFREEGG